MAGSPSKGASETVGIDLAHSSHPHTAGPGTASPGTALSSLRVLKGYLELNRAVELDKTP